VGFLGRTGRRLGSGNCERQSSDLIMGWPDGIVQKFLSSKNCFVKNVQLYFFILQIIISVHRYKKIKNYLCHINKEIKVYIEQPHKLKDLRVCLPYI
jgi:hypothetical protein